MQMRRDLAIYSVVMLLSLAGAYYVSLPIDSVAVGKTEWINLDSGKVSEMYFASKAKDVKLSRDGTNFWIAVTDRSTGKDETVRFRANKDMEQVLKSFSPMLVLRTLGKVETDRLEEFGLKEPEKTFKISGDGKELLSLEIGKRAYGSRSMFVRDIAKDEVLLLDGNRLDDIEKAQTELFQRNFFDISLNDITNVKVGNGSETPKEIEHTKRDGSGNLIWTDAGQDKEKAIYKNFLDRVQKLKVEKYASDVELSALTAAQVIAQITFFKKDKEEFSLKFYHGPDGDDGKKTYWLHSSYLNTFGKLNTTRGEAIEKDFPEVTAK